jgi:hypothetical protein
MGSYNGKNASSSLFSAGLLLVCRYLLKSPKGPFLISLTTI